MVTMQIDIDAAVHPRYAARHPAVYHMQQAYVMTRSAGSHFTT